MAAQPTVFKATYSGVPVYELPIRGKHYPLRDFRAQGAFGQLDLPSQFAQVAGLDKPQRTRVLERDVQKQTHEKVQGGYGKYQGSSWFLQIAADRAGTWIPLDRGIALAQHYGVDQLFAPLTSYVPSADSPPQAPKHIVAAPTRNKRKLDEGPIAPMQPRAGRGKIGAPPKPTVQPQFASLPMPGPSASMGPAALLGRTATLDSRASGSDAGRRGRRSSFSAGSSSSPSRTPSPQPMRNGADESAGSDDDYDGTGDPIPREKPKKGKGRKSRGSGVASPIKPSLDASDELLPPAINTLSSAGGVSKYARAILDYFVSESNHVPDFLLSPPADFDPNVVIDDDGHTALHWAAAMARIRVVKLLLNAGADLFRANAEGQTALMRAVQFTNSYDLRRFGEMFELLHRSSINIDRRDRTVFHYILDLALAKGKSHAARYYLTTVLARLSEYPHEVAEILNYQDDEGETALTLAAKARSKRLVRMLIEAGASPRVRNNEGKSAEDYIIEDERYRTSSPVASATVATANATASVLAPLKTCKSEAARKLVSSVVPQLTDLIDGMAAVYDAEIDDIDRDLQHAKEVVEQLEAELRDGIQPDPHPVTVAQLQGRERELEAALSDRMAKRFRLGYEKYTRDEDEREKQIRAELGATNGAAAATGSPPALLPPDLAALYEPPDSPGASSDVFKDLEQLRRDRAGLFAEFVKRVRDRAQQAKPPLPATNGSVPSARMDKLRRLISIGCGIPLEDVDKTLPALAEELSAPATAS